MNLNVFKPKQAVESAFSAPNPGLAIALVFVSSILALVPPLLRGEEIVAFAVNVFASSYLSFFVLAILIYVVAFVLKGKAAVSGKFSGIVSGLGLIQILVIVWLIISIIPALGVISPEVESVFHGALSGEFTSGELADAVFEIGTANALVLGLFLVVGLITLVVNLIILYFVVSKLFNYKLILNIVMMAILLIILGLLPI